MTVRPTTRRSLAPLLAITLLVSGASGLLTTSEAVAAEPVPALVKDIFAGSRSSDIRYIVRLGDRILFRAQSGERDDYELWTSDGTTAGTQLLKDINPGDVGSRPAGLTVVGDRVFFAANDGNASSSRDPWVTDGTAVGTVKLLTIPSTHDFAYTYGFTALGSTAYFFAGVDNDTRVELWKSDGTTAGTVRVKDFGAYGTDFTFGPGTLTAFAGRMFFTMDDATNGRELWVSDGTEAGTTLFKDIRAGTASSNPMDLTVIGDRMYFSADDGTNGRELWISDGTASGTVLLKDLGPGDSDPRRFVAFGGLVYFNGRGELWRTDGTTTGTELVKDIASSMGVGGGDVREPTVLGDRLYFIARTSATGYQLWRSDGTEAGTVPITERRTSVLPDAFLPSDLTVAGGRLYFSAINGDTADNDRELWVSDGTTAGTRLVADIFPGPNPSMFQGPDLTGPMTVLGGRLLFIADDGVHGAELWGLNLSGTSGVNTRNDGGGGSAPTPVLTGGTLPGLPAGQGVLQLSDGTQLPLEMSSPAAGQVRYAADGVTVTLTGTSGTSATNGLVAAPTGEIACEVCVTAVSGEVIEVWMFSTPRLVAAHLVDDAECQVFAIPMSVPLDGGGPMPTGAHTLQLAIPTASGMQAINVGVTVGGPVPTSVPAGDGGLPRGGGLLAMSLALGAAALLSVRLGRREATDPTIG